MRTILPLFLTAALVACSGDDTSVPVPDSGTPDTGAKDSSTQDSSTQDSSTQDSSTQDSSTQDSSTVDVDAGPVLVNGCATFLDKTAQNDPRAISFPTGLVPAQYDPNCMKVKVGQSVTWNGAFANHPLIASGGDSGNPIATTSTGTTKSFAFPAAGTYGFACQFHGLSMFGAIQVVP